MVGAAAVLVAAAVGAGLTASAREDPTVEVGAVSVDQVRVATPPGSASPRKEQVEALEQLDGPLTVLGDDPEDFYLGPIELEFGPEAWVMTAGATEDFDGDGKRERLLTELRGLVGRPVTAMVRLDSDGDEASVYRLNGLTFRDSAGGRPPWIGEDADVPDAATWQTIRSVAATAIGPGAVVDELEWQSAGDVAWEVDVIAADGREHTVLLDARARVLDVRLGD
jgi:hypothetical protein